MFDPAATTFRLNPPNLAPDARFAGFPLAFQDIAVDRAFLVYPGSERYPKGEGVEAIGLRDLAAELAALLR